MFEIGDRVVCLENYDNAPIAGREATIVHVYGHDHLCLEFDEVVGPHCGHSCDGHTKTDMVGMFQKTR